MNITIYQHNTKDEKMQIYGNLDEEFIFSMKKNQNVFLKTTSSFAS